MKQNKMNLKISIYNYGSGELINKEVKQVEIANNCLIITLPEGKYEAYELNKSKYHIDIIPLS